MSIKAKPSFSLKDRLFNKQSVHELAVNLKKASAKFDAQSFEKDVLKAFPKLELKERIKWLVTQLEVYLPDDFVKAQKVLLRALPAPLDPTLSDDDFGKFIWVVPGEFVAKIGCEEKHLNLSLAFLREATKRFTSEAAIRPFLNKYPEQTLAFVHDCVKDKNYHVRRLATEGIRPYLPWAERVMLPVPSVIEVLEKLHADETRYVTRSVANTLNDLSKIEPDVVIQTLQKWQSSKRQVKQELQWMTRHALRTLLKEDHAGALQLFGYPLKPKFRLSQLQASESVKIGDDFQISCSLTSSAKQALKITLQFYFLKANGSHGKKVFAVKDAQFSKGESLEISKRLSFKPITTRTMYPGTHHAEILVNGVSRGKQTFELTL